MCQSHDEPQSLHRDKDFDWESRQWLGEGRFSVVYSVRYMYGGLTVALKVVCCATGNRSNDELRAHIVESEVSGRETA